MEKNTKKSNNKAHVYGFINGVRINPLEGGRTAINLDVCSLEQYKDKDGESQTHRTYHRVSVFTDDKKAIAAYKKIAKDVDANAANRGVEGYEPKPHAVSLDGIMIGEAGNIQIVALPENVKLDAKQEKDEVRNSAVLSGNIASVTVHEDQKFAVVTLMHHYRPEGGEEKVTTIDIRINGERKPSAAAYQAAVEGKLKKGDFVRMGGQLHNNNFENKEGDKVYRVVMDLTSFDMLKEKEAKKEEVAKTEKKATKKAASKNGALKV